MTLLLIVLLGLTWWADTHIKEEPTIGQAASHVILVNCMAGSWALAVALLMGLRPAAAFATGYAMEWALSLDNMLAIAMVFAYFRLPKRYELRILRYGIISVAVFRLLFTIVGASLLSTWGRPMEVIFSAVIMWTAIKMMRMAGEQQHAEVVDHNARWYIRVLRGWVPITGDATTPVFFKKKFVSVVGSHAYHVKTHATPLLACLVAVEATDIVFSLDSAPVVVAVGQDPLIIYSSMMFAVIGLRSMYFLMQAAQRYLRWMPQVVIAVLIFMALKLLVHGLLDVDMAWYFLPLIVGLGWLSSFGEADAKED